jgi:hypothetical protein
MPRGIFGDHKLTACKPISDDGPGDHLAACVDAPARRACVLPIGVGKRCNNRSHSPRTRCLSIAGAAFGGLILPTVST